MLPARVPAHTPAPERIALPTPPSPAAAPGFPLIATLAPVAVSLALWMLTGSVYSLLFAVLGPVVAIGGLVDGRFGRRRNARRDRVRYLAALRRTGDAIDEAHRRERDRLRLLTDVTGAEWGLGRGVPVPVRVGVGRVPGHVVLSGDDPDDAPDEVVAALHEVRSSAAELRDAPIVVDARSTIGVVGPPVLAAAVARAIALRIAALLSPVGARLSAPPGETWSGALPHAVDEGEPGRYVFREGDDDPVVVSWAVAAADLAHGSRVVVATGPETADAVPDAMSTAEATDAAGRLRSLAEARGLRPEGDSLPLRVHLADLLPLPPGGSGLPAPVGVGAGGTVVLDLVADGPHAVIAGTTGSGKSELLVAWILGIAAGRTPDEVTFLLVDFKGGSAFAPLAVLPHVLATLTDLDARRTRRAIESLRAELLHRERVLAAASARSIDDLQPGALPRLVVVVDEFAAVVAESPELHDVFGDLAARGRSLGLHLILCTQRPAGVIRDAVLANTTLRLSLRVTDRADSLAMLGSDAAARLPAEPRGRGIVLGDGSTRTVQLAITGPEDAARIAAGSPSARLTRPWCDPLPAVLPLDSIPSPEDGIAFGLADLPAEQLQPVAAHEPRRHGHLLVLGGAGAGSTVALQTLAIGARRSGMRVTLVPADPADAWGVLTAESEGQEEGDSLLLIDDLDALIARFDADHRPEVIDLLTGLARGAGAARPALAVSAHRLSGPLAGIAGLFGSRLLLRQSSREEHVLCGGDPRAFDPGLPPGAGTWRGAVVQVALPSHADRESIAGLLAAVPPVHVDPADHAVLAIVAGRPRTHLARLRETGARVIELGAGPAPSADELHVATGPVPTILVGDPDAWLADWTLLSAARRDWPIVLIDVTAADHRTLLRDRTLPPPLAQAPGECWLSVDGRTRRAILSMPGTTRESEEKHPGNR